MVRANSRRSLGEKLPSVGSGVWCMDMASSPCYDLYVATQSIPLTVEEYERIPDPPGGHYELHHGELVFVTYPVRQHKDLQRHVRKLLEPVAEPLGFLVDTEYPYRPVLDGPQQQFFSSALHFSGCFWKGRRRQIPSLTSTNSAHNRCQR